MQRNKIIDICKGILIWFVVLGHTPFINLDWLHTVIFWFHMPVFFMLTGYLTNWEKYDWKEFFIKRCQNYIIPYFIFSSFLIIIYRDWVKGTIKTILGGRINTTSYSYPFWFITGLFLSVCLYKFLLDNIGRNLEILICAGMWGIGHIISTLPRIPEIPWGGEYVIIIVPYLAIGREMRKKNILNNLKLGHYIITAIVLSIIICTQYSVNEMTFDIKSYNIHHFILDIVIPIAAFFTLFGISKIIFMRTRVLSFFLQKIGEGTIVIYYLHAMLLEKINIMAEIAGDISNLLMFVITIFIVAFCMMCYIFTNKVEIARRWLLGKE